MDLNNKNEVIWIDWDDLFIQLSRSNDKEIIQKFTSNLQYFLILSEIFNETMDEKLLIHLYKIISVIHIQKPKYLAQVDLFVDQSIPKHPLAHLIKLLLFCDTKNKDIQLRVKNVLIQLDNYSYYTKYNLLKLIYHSISYYGEDFLLKLDFDNINLLYDILNEFDTRTWQSLKDIFLNLVTNNE